MISRIKDRISQSGENHEKAFIRAILKICREFGCLPNDVLKGTTIPQYIAMIDDINETELKKRNGN